MWSTYVFYWGQYLSNTQWLEFYWLLPIVWITHQPQLISGRKYLVCFNNLIDLRSSIKTNYSKKSKTYNSYITHILNVSCALELLVPVEKLYHNSILILHNMKDELWLLHLHNMRLIAIFGADMLIEKLYISDIDGAVKNCEHNFTIKLSTISIIIMLTTVNTVIFIQNTL